MKKIVASQISEKVKELFLKANYYIDEELTSLLQGSLKKETSILGQYALDLIIKNNYIAQTKKIPICQDTGLGVVFVELGQNIHIIDGNFKEAINKGVQDAYKEGYFRKLVVDDPLFERKNTNTNTPAIIYTDIISGDIINFLVIPKGFGAENMSNLKMLRPSDGKEKVIDFVIDTVKKAGANPCPPTIIGIGIGGTIDQSMVIAKKVIFRKIGQRNHNEKYASLEIEILENINKLGIGPAGLGGRITSLDVHIDYLPTHIAGLPVAVNICCHSARYARGQL
jgi:fumarate hydratase subunit alpha